MSQRALFDTSWSEDELANEMGVSVRTIKRWRAARTGPPFMKLERRVYYRKRAVQEWMQGLDQDGQRSAQRRCING